MRIGVLVRVLLTLLSACTALRVNQLVGRNPLGAARAQETTLGAPIERPDGGVYTTSSGVTVSSSVVGVDDTQGALNELITQIDNQKGLLLTSSYEFPGRYTRWSVGFTAPAIQISGTGLDFQIAALNERGMVLADIIKEKLLSETNLFSVKEKSETREEDGAVVFSGSVKASGDYFPEEERSKQPSLFSLVRTVRDIFADPSAGQLGLYGALGYDLTFQFEPITLKKDRGPEQRDLLMYLPDEILVVDNQKNDAWRVQYDFIRGSKTTQGLPRTPSLSPYKPATSDNFLRRESEPGAYAESVVQAKEQFRVGNLFEVVISQLFREKAPVPPSTIFRRLCVRNPSPYGFFINLGKNEYLVGASPEMFVRVERTRQGMRVETCPISGTIARGSDPLEDAQQIKKLIMNSKEESELTMCTDVDRNDKSRICQPGTVRVLGRRQIEMYSKLIHTVDHVEGYLREQFDALDAFLCHTWAVTVTGAPKTWAIRFLEQTEKGVRHWYGGAVGMLGFDGTLNTGLTLRTIRIKDGLAEVRAGATLLHDSDPASEEAETELKASALLDAIVRGGDDQVNLDIGVGQAADEAIGVEETKEIKAAQVLLVDHEDSFVHTLANYLRQAGAEVVTTRSGDAFNEFVETQVKTGKFNPTLAVLSPGPGSPTDFKLSHTIDTMIERKVPIFGVCLGLQGLVEHFGGDLSVLDYPMHGKPSPITRKFSDGQKESDVLEGLSPEFQVARYHSLHGDKETHPNELVVTATTQDGCIMAIQHESMPIAAVQFHPESILTAPENGMQIIRNALKLKSDQYD